MNQLPSNLNRKENKLGKFSGITKEEIKSIGSSVLKFSIYDNSAKHNFHVVNDNLQFQRTDF